VRKFSELRRELAGKVGEERLRRGYRKVKREYERAQPRKRRGRK
jgi:hypothetical protein